MEENQKDINLEQEEVDTGAEQTQAPSAHEGEKPTEAKKKVRLSDILSGRVLSRQGVINQLPLALLIVVYSFVLIGNRYSIESLTIENKRLQDEIDELRVRQIQNSCDYMNSIMLTEVSERLKETGIKAGTTPSMKITIKEKKRKNDE